MPKIVIVEDDPMISEIYQKKFLEAGFEVFAAGSGEEVLTLAKRERPNVILLDLVMPKMNGFETIERLRKDGMLDIKIFVFSNLSQKEDRERAMSLGADGFVVKSDYTPSGLVKEVQRLLNIEVENGKNGKSQEMKKGNVSDEEVLKKGETKKILLIEDEEVFADMFGEKLRQDGFEVVIAKNGAWGVKEALKGEYDLLIIDMVMPAMTGEEMIARLKLEEKTKNIPIVILSASLEEEAINKVREMGISEFYIKTQLIPSELSEKIKEILS